MVCVYFRNVSVYSSEMYRMSHNLVISPLCNAMCLCLGFDPPRLLTGLLPNCVHLFGVLLTVSRTLKLYFFVPLSFCFSIFLIMDYPYLTFQCVLTPCYIENDIDSWICQNKAHAVRIHIYVLPLFANMLHVFINLCLTCTYLSYNYKEKTCLLGSSWIFRQPVFTCKLNWLGTFTTISIKAHDIYRVQNAHLVSQDFTSLCDLLQGANLGKAWPESKPLPPPHLRPSHISYSNQMHHLKPIIEFIITCLYFYNHAFPPPLQGPPQ